MQNTTTSLKAYRRYDGIKICAVTTTDASQINEAGLLEYKVTKSITLCSLTFSAWERILASPKLQQELKEFCHKKLGQQ